MRTAQQGEIAQWVRPETKRKATLRAKDRANASRWGLDIAIFLFGILAIVFILSSEKVSVWLLAFVAVLGLAMVWLAGWRRARQAFGRFLEEELARYPDDWLDYYAVLRISPNADSNAISEAHQRVSRVLSEHLSDEAKRMPYYSQMLSDANEAYQVLSDPAGKAAYDRLFWLNYEATGAVIDPATRNELAELSQSISEQVSEGERRTKWRITELSARTKRALAVAAVSFAVILFGGSSLAFAKPEHALATPFRGIATGLVRTSAGAVELIEGVRGIAAMFERQVISTAFQSMRADRGLKEIRAVTASTNDMASFPSREHPLFPEYLDKRSTQFKYTVDSAGIIGVDTSGAMTDAFLDRIKRTLDRLDRANSD